MHITRLCSAAIVSLVLSIAPSNIEAQVTTVPDAFKNMNMRSIGPAVMSGRVTSIDVDPLDENIIYVGTASGGLWKSESGGTTWTPLFDKQDLLGIGAVCVDPNNHDVIWAGTGEGNPRNSQTSGAGIFKSLDAGKSWKKMGLEQTWTIHRVVVDPRKSERAFAAAHGSAWIPNKDRGVYITDDGGNSWQQILFVNDTTGCADLVMDPANPDRLIAAMYHYQRTPYHFTSGGKGSGLHITVDGGKSWTKLTDKQGLPEGEWGRIGLAFAPNNSKVVYALIECAKTALYRSNDGGFTWSMVTDKGVGDRPFYYHELYVDPSNENHLIYLHSTVSESIDGGKTWTTLLPYSGVHPDHHAFWWSAQNPKFMIEGNDGGLNISRDGGRNWTFINNLPLGQFYHVDYDMDVPYNIYGGMQDNGSWKGAGYVFHGGGIRSADWQELLFGDGFDVLPQPNKSRFAYAMSQGGEVHYIDTETGKMSYVKPVHPEGKKLRFNWNAAISRDPYNDQGLYFGSQYLHHSTNHGLSWEMISPDLTTNDSLKLKDQHKTGGITPDVTNAENHCTILCITPSEDDPKEIWVGTDDGQLQLTQDGGKSWNNLSASIKGFPKAAWIPQITLGAVAGEVWVVVNNYRQGDKAPYLFYTSDHGKSWTNKAITSQVQGHCLSVVQDKVEPKLVFLGTEHGLFVSFDRGSNWMKWTHDYPSVATQDLKIHPRENDLIIGTFGRAIYVLDNIEPLRRFAQKGSASFEKKIFALDSPTAYITSWQQPAGERFPADMHFAGENKQTRAQLCYFFNVDKEVKEDAAVKKEKSDKKSAENKAEEKKEKKDKKVTIHVLTLAGDTLRTFKHEPDTGINVVGWWFETKGVRFPSQEDPKTDAEEEGNGYHIAPGKYKVMYHFNQMKDSTYLNVDIQPGQTWNETDYANYMALVKRGNAVASNVEAAMQQLRDAQKSIDMVRTAMVFADDSVKKSLNTSMDSLDQKIKSFHERIFGKENQKGINDDSHTLQSKIYSTLGLINEFSNGQNAENAMHTLESESTIMVKEMEKFINEPFAKFKSEIERMQFQFFKNK